MMVLNKLYTAIIFLFFFFIASNATPTPTPAPAPKNLGLDEEIPNLFSIENFKYVACNPGGAVQSLHFHQSNTNDYGTLQLRGPGGPAIFRNGVSTFGCTLQFYMNMNDIFTSHTAITDHILNYPKNIHTKKYVEYLTSGNRNAPRFRDGSYPHIEHRDGKEERTLTYRTYHVSADYVIDTWIPNFHHKFLPGVSKNWAPNYESVSFPNDNQRGGAITFIAGKDGNREFEGAEISYLHTYPWRRYTPDQVADTTKTFVDPQVALNVIYNFIQKSVGNPSFPEEEVQLLLEGINLPHQSFDIRGKDPFPFKDLY